MNNIRAMCSSWALKTYRDGLNDLAIADEKLYKQAINIFTILHIIDIPMDGYSCEKLPKTEEARTGIRKTYSEIFHEEIVSEHFTPASYLVRLIRECNDSVSDTNKIIGALARGLRTLTSLLREPDFAFLIQQQLINVDPSTKINLNAKQDSSDHTDVLLTFYGNEYRIWLYQFSARGLPHDIERLTGKRGTLPNGIHVICPLHTELAIQYDTLCKRNKRLHDRLNTYEEQLNECSIRAVKKRELLLGKITNITEELNRLQPIIDIEYEHSSQELDIVNGWYFYSENYIERVIKYITALSTPTSYDEVVKILLAPEKYVGSIHAFVKGV